MRNLSVIIHLQLKQMMKRFIIVLLLLPILMAMQCNEDDGDTSLAFNDYNIYITPQQSFSINDTIWINGIVSSRAYDLNTNDSITADRTTGDTFSLFKFTESTQNFNCIDAIDKFELIYDIGGASFLPSCENAQMTVHPETTIDSLSYKYRIGLKALYEGDYVISWQNSVIQNEDRNEFIINNYPLENHSNQIGFNKCGDLSWRYLNESDKEYYFNVE